MIISVWKPAIGERLRLRRFGDGFNWTGIGRVVKLPRLNDYEVGLEMDTNVEIPRSYTTEFSVSRVWIPTSYERYYD